MTRPVSAMFPHPLVRLLLLLLLAGCLPGFDWPALALVLAALVLLSSMSPAADWKRLLRAVARLRWLLASILVLHLGFAPDRLPAFGGAVWFPTPGAARTAAEHCLLLVVLLAGVELLRQTTSADRVAAALVGLLAPLRVLGVDTSRFALRLALTMEAVPETGRLLGSFARERPMRPRSLSAWAEAAATLVRATEREAAAGRPLRLAVLPPLQYRDWLVLGAGTLALALLGAA